MAEANPPAPEPPKPDWILNYPTTTAEQQPDGSILKSGPRVRKDELYAMKFALELGLPVPRVLDSREKEDGSMAIKMEYIPGETLDKALPKLSTEQLRHIGRQLRGIVSTMRSAAPTQSTIGPIGGGKARELRRYNAFAEGPFETEAAFNEFYLDLPDWTPSLLETALRQRLLADHRLVFSHGDFCPYNIIVDDGEVKALIDWEMAGWYPEHWEFIKFFDRVPHPREWEELSNVIFEQQYLDELCTHTAVKPCRQRF